LTLSAVLTVHGCELVIAALATCVQHRAVRIERLVSSINQSIDRSFTVHKATAL